MSLPRLPSGTIHYPFCIGFVLIIWILRAFQSYKQAKLLITSSGCCCFFSGYDSAASDLLHPPRSLCTIIKGMLRAALSELDRTVSQQLRQLGLMQPELFLLAAFPSSHTDTDRVPAQLHSSRTRTCFIVSAEFGLIVFLG